MRQELLGEGSKLVGSHGRLSDSVAAHENDHGLGEGRVLVFQKVVQLHAIGFDLDGIHLEAFKVGWGEFLLDLFAKILGRLLRVSRLGAVQDPY